MSGIIGSVGSKSGVIGKNELYYEEGTWTPINSNFDTFAGDVVFQATYVRIGALVYCSFHQSGGTSLSWSAAQSFKGLPFDVMPNFGGSCYALDSGPTHDLGPVLVWYNSECYMQYAATDNRLTMAFTFRTDGSDDQ